LNEEIKHIDDEGKKIGMWFFLCTEILFFGGMFLLYSIYRNQYAPDFHRAAADEDITMGTINTVILLTSSLLIALAVSAIRKGQMIISMLLQAATIFLGLAFLGIKYWEWSTKIAMGLFPNSPILLQLEPGQIMFFGLYYVMTGLHGLHVLIGCAVISFMIVFTQRGKINRENYTRLENTGLYWHFVDIVWIYLYPLFYLIT